MASPTPWTPLPYSSPWADYGLNNQVGQYMKDAAGWVHVRGLVQATGGSFTPGGAGATIATLPAGSRSAANEIFECPCYNQTAYGVCRVDIGSSGPGQLMVVAGIAGGTPGAQNTWVSLAGIRFWVGY